jgi:hypothetical protein
VPKGKEVNIPLAGCGHCGNTNEVRDAGMNPLESYLFFLTTFLTVELDYPALVLVKALRKRRL